VSFHRFNQSVFQQNRPIATDFSLGPNVSFGGEAEVGRAAEPAASVEYDPEQTPGLAFSAGLADRADR
jgi:hypothetical protein